MQPAKLSAGVVDASHIDRELDFIWNGVDGEP